MKKTLSCVSRNHHSSIGVYSKISVSAQDHLPTWYPIKIERSGHDPQTQTPVFPPSKIVNSSEDRKHFYDISPSQFCSAAIPRSFFTALKMGIKRGFVLFFLTHPSVPAWIVLLGNWKLRAIISEHISALCHVQRGNPPSNPILYCTCYIYFPVAKSRLFSIFWKEYPQAL